MKSSSQCTLGLYRSRMLNILCVFFTQANPNQFILLVSPVVFTTTLLQHGQMRWLNNIEARHPLFETLHLYRNGPTMHHCQRQTAVFSLKKIFENDFLLLPIMFMQAVNASDSSIEKNNESTRSEWDITISKLFVEKMKTARTTVQHYIICDSYIEEVWKCLHVIVTKPEHQQCWGVNFTYLGKASPCRLLPGYQNPQPQQCLLRQFNHSASEAKGNEDTLCRKTCMPCSSVQKLCYVKRCSRDTWQHFWLAVHCQHFMKCVTIKTTGRNSHDKIPSWKKLLVEDCRKKLAWQDSFRKKTVGWYYFVKNLSVWHITYG